MKTKIILGVAIGLIVISIISLSVLFIRDIPNNRLPMNLSIEDRSIIGLGATPGTNDLCFGTLPLGAINSERNITITNDFKTDRMVELIAIGELGGWISYSDNGFILKPKEAKDVTLTATIPENVKVGNYTGELLIYLRKV